MVTQTSDTECSICHGRPAPTVLDLPGFRYFDLREFRGFHGDLCERCLRRAVKAYRRATKPKAGLADLEVLGRAVGNLVEVCE